MSWKQILKIDMDEARELGDKYAPKDMEQGRKDIAERKEKLRQLQIEESLPKRRRKLQRYINWMRDNPEQANSELGNVVQVNIDMAKENLMEPENFDRFITAVQLLLRDLENAPKRSTTRKEREELDRQIPKSRRRTNLIDRAKKANRDDPRMGSGRETKKAAGNVSSKTSGVHRVSYSNRRDKDDKDE